MQHIPVELHLNLLALLHLWACGEVSPSAAVDRLARRLRADLAGPLVDEALRSALTQLVDALNTHHRAAVALAAHLYRDETDL